MDVRVVRGSPTDEELAALVAVLATRTAPPPAPPRLASQWRDRAARLGVRRTGPRAWWASGLPG